MSVLKEQYIINDDAVQAAYGNTWVSQCFLATSNYNLTSVKLLLYKVGAPGTVTVSIRQINHWDQPTGTDLCSATFDGDSVLETDIPTVPDGLTEIPFNGVDCPIIAGIKYAIVVRCTGIAISNSVRWRFDSTDWAYQTFSTSGNAGATWTASGSGAFLFQTYGDTITLGITKYDFLDGGNNSQAEFSTTFYGGQTFTPSVPYEITSIKLKLDQSGWPNGTIWGYLTATDEDGLPTTILATTTIPGASIIDYKFYEFIFAHPVLLIAGVKYAFWVKRDTTDGDIIIWGESAGGSTYEGGNLINYVGSWSNDADLDSNFEIYGNSVPYITDQSSSISVPEWSGVSFFVTAEGSEPLTYQWYKDAADIDGETDAILDLGSVVMSDAGVYTCVVTNDYNSDESDPITLTVTVIPTPGGNGGLSHKRNIFNLPLDLDCEDV